MVKYLFGLFAIVTVWVLVVPILPLISLTVLQAYWATLVFSVWLADHVTPKELDNASDL